MAAITSLGIHKPIGLQQLIDLGDVEDTSSSDQYCWETYVSDTRYGPVAEEVLYTKKCVIWSQANAVRTVYRFDLEDEDVQQAFVTSFPANDIVKAGSTQYGSKNEAARTKGSHSSLDHAFASSLNDSRALTVLLKSKLHIYFLHGSHHVVDLPFAVSRAWPTPHGVLLSRSDTSLRPPISTPKVPPAPHNSFFSSQPSFKSSQLQSPSTGRRIGKDVPRLKTQTNDAKLEEIWQSMIGPQSRTQESEEGMTFTLIDPFSEPGTVTEAHRSPMLRLSGRSRNAPNIDFDPLDPAEQVVYISPIDELQHDGEPTERRGSLLLLVTVNSDRGTLTVWHGWYLRDKSLLELMKKRNEAKAEKVRRRSSFLSASIGTGTTTPAALRNREALRESFAAMSQVTTTTTRKATAQIDEAVMASQLDPDFAIEGTQQSTKEVSRRISSLVSRGEASSNVGTSFGAGAYRRGASFGGTNERRSFGLRRSRGSTTGSILSRSFGVEEDDIMDFDNESELDLDETVADSVQLIRATHDATGADSLMGTLEGGLKHDLVVQRLHVFSLDTKPRSDDNKDHTVKVITIEKSRLCTKTEDSHNVVYLHHARSGTLFSLSLQIKQQPLYPGQASSPHVAIPIVSSHNKEASTRDITLLGDNGINAVLLGGTDIRFAGSDITCTTSKTAPYRHQNPFTPSIESTASTESVGRNRTIVVTEGHSVYSHASLDGRFDETFHDGTPHRRSVRLRPIDPAIDAILRVCEIVLPAEIAHTLRPIWLVMYQTLLAQPGLMFGTACTAEMIATAAVVLAQVLGLLDQRSKAAMRLARVATSKQSTHQRRSLHHDRAAMLCTKPAWAALDRSRPSTMVTKSSLDQAIPIAVALADDVCPRTTGSDLHHEGFLATKLMLGLHILSEERLLNVCTTTKETNILAPIIAALGQWLNLNAWSSHAGSYYDLGGASALHWSFVKSSAYRHSSMEIMETPIGVFEWLGHSISHKSAEQYPTLHQISQLGAKTDPSSSFVSEASKLTPRTTMMSSLLKATQAFTIAPVSIVEAMRDAWHDERQA